MGRANCAHYSKLGARRAKGAAASHIVAMASDVNDDVPHHDDVVLYFTDPLQERLHVCMGDAQSRHGQPGDNQPFHRTILYSLRVQLATP